MKYRAFSTFDRLFTEESLSILRPGGNWPGGLVIRSPDKCSASLALSRAELAYEQQAYFRSSLLFIRKRRERTDDRFYVYCSQVSASRICSR